MNRKEIRDRLLRILCEIAPEGEPEQMGPQADLREELDLDSMDFQRYLVAIHEQLHVEIPNQAYEQFTTLDGGVNFVAEATGVSQR